jgi:hypothetical protein
MKNDDWIIDRVAYLNGLKSRNDQQALLVLLAENKNRTAQDNKKLSTLIKAEKAGVRASKARQEAANLINADKRAAKESERKARNHRLMLQGVLFDLAGLENRSRGELLGLLLAASTTDDPQRWTNWKIRGDGLLAEKDVSVNVSAAIG